MCEFMISAVFAIRHSVRMKQGARVFPHTRSMRVLDGGSLMVLETPYYVVT